MTELQVADDPRIIRMIDAIRKQRMGTDDGAMILVSAGKMWKAVSTHRDFESGKFLGIRCVSVSKLDADFKLVSVIE